MEEDSAESIRKSSEKIVNDFHFPMMKFLNKLVSIQLRCLTSLVDEQIYTKNLKLEEGERKRRERVRLLETEWDNEDVKLEKGRKVADRLTMPKVPFPEWMSRRYGRESETQERKSNKARRK